jgi:hypothetical protein
VAEAGTRLDRITRAAKITHRAILTGPLWELWAQGGTASGDTVTVQGVDSTLRMRSRDYKRTGVVASFDSVWAQRHSAELQRPVAEQRADTAA